MYGTIARLHLKPGMAQQLSENMNRQADEVGPKGALATFVYQSDNDPNEMFLVVAFESKEAYKANAESPEQNERFLDMMKSLDSEPEWHDGEIVWSFNQ